MAAEGGHGVEPSLERMFRARSIALVGATERSAWSNMAFRNFERLGYQGRVHLINRRGGVIYGKNAATSCVAVGETIDAALMMVPVEVMGEAFADLQAAGVRNAVILAAGFAEAGGADRQHELLRQARDAGLTLIGPNCLGFINYVDRVPLWSTPIRVPVVAGAIALISQSGATASYITTFANEFGIGFSHVVSTGNEADLSVARVARYLVDDPATKVIALFVETVRDRAALIETAELARRANKPIIVFKVGSSEAAAKAAQAHTGSLVGDDRVFDAACQRHGIIRVRSIEDLVFTAELLARTGPIRRRALGALAISGGVCEIAADRAAVENVPLALLGADTQAQLQQVLPQFGTVHNPLDVTGAAVLDPSLFDRCVSAFVAESQVGLIACFSDVAADGPSAVEKAMLTHIGAALSRGQTPGVVMSIAPRRVDEGVKARVDAARVHYLPSGVQHGLFAIGAAFRWSAWLDAVDGAATVAPALSERRPASERETLEFLAQHGLPVIPAVMAKTADEAAAAAANIGGEVALKIASPDIAHKSDIGGVRLGVCGDEAVTEAFRTIIANTQRACADARIDGVIVSPMRSGGLELFVGTLRDPQWGPVISVGLGGIWVEALRDTSLRLLPVSEADALAMLSELRGARLLDGYRGAPAVDRQAIARAVVQIGEAALALGPDLLSLEVNPLLAAASGVEALDALALWAADPA
jgi:acyl-CoA synthetase (NDP forming)